MKGALQKAEYFIEDSPDMLLLIMAPNPESINFKLRQFFAENLKKKKEGKYKNIESFFHGTCFGRYDVVADVRSVDVRTAFSCAHRIHSKILANQSRAWLSLICCHRLVENKRINQHVRDTSLEHPIHAYSFFRMKETNVKDVLRQLNSPNDAGEGNSLRKELLWNRSTYSYVLRISGQKFSDIADYIYLFRQFGDFLKDFCTFASLGYGKKDTASREAIGAQINLKVYDQEIVDEIFTRYPRAVLRLGHFDVIIHEEKGTLGELMNSIIEIRQILSRSRYPNRTATILLLSKPPSLRTGRKVGIGRI